ncbi:MAG: geranylgeranyl reductase family protein [Candidatus Hodarchaeales archaeon]
MDVDVLIVGLGPAGASVLHNLNEVLGSDHKVLAIDYREQVGYPVQCGEFMPSPSEMEILMKEVPNAKELFYFEDKYISQKTNRISFNSPNAKVIQTPFQGCTIHRGKWNSDLVNESKSKAVEIWTSSYALNQSDETVTILHKDEKVEVKPKVIVGADGVSSKVAKWSGLDERRSSDHFAIVKQHFIANITSEKYDPTNIQMFFGEKYAPGAYAWVIPKSDHEANIGTGVRLPMLKKGMTVSSALNNLLKKHPVVSEIVKEARIVHTIGGAVPVGLPFKRTVSEERKVILIGDACCQVVSSVGGGIPPAIVAGQIAANVIKDYLMDEGKLSTYEQIWRSRMLKMFKRAYKIRRFFDHISTGRDSRIQWYMNRLKSQDIDDVVHCRIPWKLALASPFVDIVNFIIR